MLENIVIKGAKENNLKDINLTIPKNKLIVFSTGLPFLYSISVFSATTISNR